jgi:hypothetical protein
MNMPMIMTTEIETPARLVERCLRSPAHGWSIGIPGAIGEFMYDADETVDIRVGGKKIHAMTGRGALQVAIADSVRCVAYEAPSPCTRSWIQAIAFCVPAAAGELPARHVLTEDGPDQEAIDAAARDQILFDLGLGSPYLRFCVRCGNAQLLDGLRAGLGRSVLDPVNPAAQILRETSPVRVIMSGLGRIEIYQAIPAAGQESPAGPHTHFLPQLLGRIPAADPDPVPPGFIAALTLYPEHPLFDKSGNRRPFDRRAYDAFQDLLARHGPADYQAAKNRFSNGIGNGGLTDPQAVGATSCNRLAAAVVRLQYPHLRNL